MVLLRAEQGICCRYISRLSSGILMLKLSLRSESCKHSCMLWGASAINPGKANGFGFDLWGDLFFFWEVIHHPIQIYLFASSFQPCFSFITSSATSSFLHSISQYALLTTPPARKLSPSLSLWYLPMRSVVGGLMFSQVGEGHFSQMDMSCGAMPSQLHWREPWGLERSKPGRQWEKGELSLARRGSPAPWAKLESRKGRNQDKEMDRGQKRWQSWWQTNIKKEKKKKKREGEKLYTMDCRKPDGSCTKAHFRLQNYIWHSGAYVLGVIHTDSVHCWGFSGTLRIA